MGIARKLLFGTLAILLGSIPAFPQSTRPSFEVASIKANNSGAGNSLSGVRPGGYYFANNTPVKFLIMQAYRVQDFQVQGGPGWINSAAFDIEARADEGAVPPLAGPPDPNRPDAMALMLQSLLEDRFHLKLHHEARELPVYNLVVAKSGSKLQAAFNERPGPGGLAPGNSRTNFSGSSVQMTGSALSIAMFASGLAQQLRRPIIDKTNLTGLFDITLKWIPSNAPPDSVGTSIFTAIEEQLGLKLESAKGPVGVLIIDSVEKPTEN